MQVRTMRVAPGRGDPEKSWNPLSGEAQATQPWQGLWLHKVLVGGSQGRQADLWPGATPRWLAHQRQAADHHTPTESPGTSMCQETWTLPSTRATGCSYLPTT